MIIMGNDIIERMQAAEDSKTWYEQTVSMISAIIWRYEVDSKGEHVGSYISPVADRMLGLPDDTIGNSFDKYFSYIHPDDLPAMQELLFEGIRKLAKDLTAEYRLRKADGTMLWVRSQGSAYSQPDGQIIGVGTTSEIAEQKNAEESLRESEGQLAHIIDFLPDATFAIDREGQVIAWNRSIEEMTGTSKNEILGKKGFAHAVPFYGDSRPILIDLIFMDQKDIEKKYNFILRKGDQLTAEVFVPSLRKDKGAYLWGIAAPLCDSSGNVMGAIESIRDITESKRAEKALHESEALYSAVVGQAFDIIFLVDVNTKSIVDGNIAFQEMLGYGLNDLSGLTLYDIIHDKESIERNIDPIKASENFFIGPRQYRRKDGSIIDVEASSTLIHYEEKEVLCVIARDITERKRVENELRESEARYKRIVETANEGIMVMDDQFRYAFVNQKLANMLGYQQEEMLGRPVISFIYEEDLPDHRAMMEMRISGAGAQYERRHRRKDGSCCWTIVSATSLKDEAGQFAGSFAMFTDITERKQVEEELRGKTALLEAQVEISRDGILVVDSQGQRILTNQRLLTMWNVPPQEIGIQKNNQPFLQYLAGKTKNADKFLEKVKYLYGNQDETSRDEIEFEDGMVLDRYSSPVIGRDSKYYGRIWIFHDITDYKHALKALHESEQRLADIIDFLPDATFAVDREGKVIAWNRAIEEMTGVLKAEMMGKGNYAYSVPFYGERRPILIDLIFMDRKEIEEKYYFVLRKGDQLIAETFIPMLNGKKDVFLWGIASPLYDSSGSIVGAIESIRDITRYKRFEEELKNTNLQLETTSMHDSTDGCNGRTGQCSQERIPGQYEPRDPHPFERRHRHDRIAAGYEFECRAA